MPTKYEEFYRQIYGRGRKPSELDWREKSRLGMPLSRQESFQKLGGRFDEANPWVPLDELGYPARLPEGHIAEHVQFLSNKAVARRNARLAMDAYRTHQGALGQLESFRPGSAVALASPHYSGMAQSLLAGRTQAPDLLHYKRQDYRKEARKDARQGQYLSLAGTVLTAAATLAAPMFAPVAGVAAAGAATQQARATSDQYPAPIGPGIQQNTPQPGTAGSPFQGPVTAGQQAATPPATGPMVGPPQPGQARAGQAGQGPQQGPQPGPGEQGERQVSGLETGEQQIDQGGEQGGGEPGGEGGEAPQAGSGGEQAVAAPQGPIYNPDNGTWDFPPTVSREGIVGAMAERFGPDVANELFSSAYAQVFADDTFWDDADEALQDDLLSLRG